jgi:DNA repair exonuclease SbcCD ATPase subunit
MKKICVSICFLAATQLSAQKISVSQSNEKFSTGSQNAVTTTIMEAELNDVISEWKKVLKSYKYDKVKDDNNEVFGDNVLIKDWGDNTADFYTKFDENKKDKTIKMSTAVDLGGTYMESGKHSDKVKYVEKMMKEFAIKMTKEPIEKHLKDADKDVSKQEDKQKDLEKNNKDLHDDITDYNAKIAKAEKELVVKEAELKKKEAEVNVQKKVVSASSDAVSEQAKSSKKILDKLEDQQKDLEKDKKELQNDISDYKEKIKKAEKDIKTNEEDQKKQKEVIETSKKSRDEVKKKLDSVS